jgi:heterogeneous nuclear ribonucleoprotein F/H
MFHSREGSQRALAERHKQTLGQRWIELVEIDREEYDTFNLKKESPHNVRCGDRVTDENVMRCVKLRGLPFTSTKHDVIEFFTGLSIPADCITFDVQNGKNTGYAVIEFKSE